MKIIHILIPSILTLFLSCSGNEEGAGAYGNFEANEVIVSAEAQGRIVTFEPVEGTRLKEGEVVVVIDTTQLTLKKEQLESGKTSLGARIRTLDAEVHANRVQLKNLEREEQRIDRLVEGGAATSKQKDDIVGQIALMEAKIAAVESQDASVHAERRTLEIQISQVEDQIRRSSVRNPVDGVILAKYREKGEMAMPGQPLYKTASMDTLILRAYISGEQLSAVKTGQVVQIMYDVPGGMKECSGVVSWISPRAEFTPKIIQTREERVNLVYAIKVQVPNEGSLKIGMPGEVHF
ncbi:MAG: efflux RND transporter periplasmic adaptor subunit [Bacteroidota bacterium]